MRSAFSLIKSAELNLIVIVSETRHGGEGIHCANVIDSDLFNSSFSFLLLSFCSIFPPFRLPSLLFLSSILIPAPLLLLYHSLLSHISPHSLLFFFSTYRSALARVRVRVRGRPLSSAAAPSYLTSPPIGGHVHSACTTYTGDRLDHAHLVHFII